MKFAFITVSRRWLDEFFFLCRKAGFKTIGEVCEYMGEQGITAQQLFNELDALCFPEFIDEGL